MSVLMDSEDTDVNQVERNFQRTVKQVLVCLFHKLSGTFLVVPRIPSHDGFWERAVSQILDVFVPPLVDQDHAILQISTGPKMVVSHV